MRNTIQERYRFGLPVPLPLRAPFRYALSDDGSVRSGISLGSAEYSTVLR